MLDFSRMEEERFLGVVAEGIIEAARSRSATFDDAFAGAKAEAFRRGSRWYFLLDESTEAGMRRLYRANRRLKLRARPYGAATMRRVIR